MTDPEHSSVLRFSGCSHFRQRLVCSTLSGKKVFIGSIRADDQNPGLRGNNRIYNLRKRPF